LIVAIQLELQNKTVKYHGLMAYLKAEEPDVAKSAEAERT
jgi:hypothetical protein